MLQLKDLMAVKVFLFVLWPVSAVAATSSFGAGLGTVSLATVAATLALSILSGLTALLHQMRKDLVSTGSIQHLGLYIVSKMLGSNMAGLFMLFATEGKFDPNYQVGAIIIAAFGGTVVLEALLSRSFDKGVGK